MEPISQKILTKYPNFIASRYKQLLETNNPQDKVELALNIYEVSIRALALSLINQYLIKDKDIVRDDPFSRLLSDALVFATFGTWTKIFYQAMEAYKAQPELLFIPELHDLYWELGSKGYERRASIRQAFDKMVQIWADSRPGSRAYPKSEAQWEELASVTVTVLHEFLEHFSFIENYRIIYISGKDEEGYRYHDYTGAEPNLYGPKIVTGQKLQADWYYLYHPDRNSLFHLHPLLVLLTNLPSVKQSSTTNIGFFDHLDQEVSYYWEPDQKALLPYPALTPLVLEWIYAALEQYKAYRRAVSQLDWAILLDTCQAISENSMGDSRVKYQKGLYLQREKVVYAFREFLDSRYTCFVLTGKSGVGKTNFILSLLDDYATQKDSLCFLMYNGAFLSADQDIKAEISNHFNQRLKFQGREEKAQIEDSLLEINRIPGITGRKFVLIVDALNENPNASQLLKGIDQMIRSTSVEQDWLKVVVTCRPEAWRRIYLQAKPLAEHRYYRLRGQQEMGIELNPFQLVNSTEPASKLSYEIGRFEKDEVSVAFEKYRAIFQLKSEYDNLKPIIRKELRDPLIMRLVAEMYSGQAIPASIRINDIYQDYVKALIRSDRLQPEDEEFLQERIVPLMAEAGYSNEVPASQINRHGLRPQILGKEVDSTGWAVNQSFQNLADADILVRHAAELDYVIRFTFERFYDYYFGQYLYGQIKEQSSPEPQYLQWLEAIQEAPFLWGAIKQVLLTHLKELPQETAGQLLYSMACKATQPVKQLLVTTLTDYYQDQPETVKTWINQLFGADPLNKDEISYPQRVAIEVAAQTETVDLLEKAAKAKSEPIRTVAIQHIYYLWRRNPDSGFAVLDNLRQEVKGRWFLPKSEILQSCIALSLTILFNHYREPGVGHNLQLIWRQILEKVLFVNPRKSGSWQENTKIKIRGIFLKGMVKFFMRSITYLPKEWTFGTADLHHFWKGPHREERFILFKDLIKVYDVETYDVREMRRVLMSAVENRDMICAWLLLIYEVVFLQQKPKDALPAIRELFAAGQQVKSTPSSFGSTPYSLGLFMSYQEKIDPDFWQAFQEMIQTIAATSHGVWYSAENSFRHLWLNYHEVLFERLHNMLPPSPLLQEILDERIRAGDYDFVKDYINIELTYRFAGVQLILPIVKFILGYGIQDQMVNDSIVMLLTRIRTQHPEEIESFLLDTEIPWLIRNQVQIQGTPERLHDLWNQAQVFAEDNLIFSRKSDLAQAFCWLLNQATECQNLADWIILLFKGITNLLYAGPVFPDVPFKEWGSTTNKNGATGQAELL